jgi:hypothetical protein
MLFNSTVSDGYYHIATWSVASSMRSSIRPRPLSLCNTILIAGMVPTVGFTRLCNSQHATLDQAQLGLQSGFGLKHI